MDNFYSGIIHSYAFANNLYYEKHDGKGLPINIWYHPESPKINKTMANAGFNTLYDLPLTDGNKIDFRKVQNKIVSTRNKK